MCCGYSRAGLSQSTSIQTALGDVASPLIGSHYLRLVPSRQPRQSAWAFWPAEITLLVTKHVLDRFSMWSFNLMRFWTVRTGTSNSLATLLLFFSFLFDVHSVCSSHSDEWNITKKHFLLHTCGWASMLIWFYALYPNFTLSHEITVSIILNCFPHYE